MRFQSIDSLRGIAALGVAATHMTGNYENSPIWTAYGYTGVFLFFVISGFCIHLRAAKGQEPKFLNFWKRRWLRLYPAYLASFLLYIWWANDFGWFFFYDMVTHLLMIHNLDARTVYSLNGVWWTLAIEEQLYLLYFLLLWMRRRWGWPIVLAATFSMRFVILAISLTLHQFQIEMPFNESALSNWWTWALGALSVEACFGLVKLPRIAYSLVLASAFFISAGVLQKLGAVPSSSISRFAAVVMPILWGSGFFIVVNRFVRDELSFRPLALIGLFSYSLYLTHEFVVGLIHPNLLFGIPLCLIFAYLFFLLFERPFMRPTVANVIPQPST